MLIVARTAASLLSLSAASSRTRHSTMASSKMFNLDEFVLRQFDDPNYSGTKIAYDKAEFEAKINAMHASGKYPLVDGYAPFCKHLFVPNVRARTAHTLRAVARRLTRFCASAVCGRQAELPRDHGGE